MAPGHFSLLHPSAFSPFFCFPVHSEAVGERHAWRELVSMV